VSGINSAMNKWSVLLLPGMTRTRDIDSALGAFSRHDGVLRTGQALAHGIHSDTLYKLVAQGKVVRLARGLYRLSTNREFTNPDLAVVATKAPGAVVCLISALAFHGITTQIPRAVSLAVPRGKYSGLRLHTPPVKIYRFDESTFEQGVEAHVIDHVTVRVYSVAKTIVDCFKYRNKIGLDVTLEALRLARARKKVSNREIGVYARILRQEKVMAPYLLSIE
jgi:predicted transcriptional regulator of viral defense system